MSEQSAKNEWTCEHGVVYAEGCDEYGCGSGHAGEKDRNLRAALAAARVSVTDFDAILAAAREYAAQAQAEALDEVQAWVAEPFPDCEGWTCQSCGADNFIPAGFARVTSPGAKRSDYLLDGSPEAVAVVRKARGLPPLNPPGESDA